MMTIKKLLTFLEEFGPLLVFFVLNSKGAELLNQPESQSLFIATGGFMAALVLALASTYLRGRKPAPMTLISGALVMVFGGATLFFQNETFIKIKPTIVYLLFAGGLTYGLTRGQSYLQKIIGAGLSLDDEGWLIFTKRWIYFFVFCAGLNEIAWRVLSTDAWVQLKVFGYLPLTFIFMLSQSWLLARHNIKPKN